MRVLLLLVGMSQDEALELISNEANLKNISLTTPQAIRLFATDASRDALGYVTDLPILDRDEGLEELERLSLVNKEADRFALLPLTKSYSENELGKDGELEGRFRERWVGYLLDFVDIQSHNWPKNWTSVKIEEKNILKIMDWCWSEYILDILIALSKKMNYFFWFTSQWNYREKYIEIGLKAADASTSVLSKAHFLRS